MDRNLRRLLEAMRKVPNARPQYVILKREEAPKLEWHQLERIEGLAEKYGRNRKVDQPYGKSEDQIQAIYSLLYEHDRAMTRQVLNELGVQVIWIDEYDEVATRLDEVGGGS